MPPTVAMLTDLAAAGRVAELLAAGRVLDPVMHPAEPGAGSAAG
jgi:hypothetical protein